MRTRILLALLAVVVMIAVAPALTAEKTTSSPRVDTTRVLLDSRPDAAEIQVDGKFIGTTPVEYRLSPGVHRLELKRGNRFSPWLRELSVGEVPTRVTALLETKENPCPR